MFRSISWKRSRDESAGVEPQPAEETIITRNHDKIPTVEIPFPEAQAELGTKASAVSAPAAAKLPPTPRKPAAPRPPMAETLRKTLTNVRAMPLWRRRIPAAVFSGIIALFVIGRRSACVR